MLKYFFLFFLTLPLAVLAESKKGGFAFSVDGGVTILSPPSSLYYPYFGPQLGLTADYYFVPQVGIYLSTFATMRGFQVANNSDSTWYLDLMVGPVFGRHGDWFSSDARGHLRLGPVFSIPLANFPNRLGLGLQSQSYVGIGLNAGALYPVSEGFALGYSILTRYGIGSPITTGYSMFWDFAISLTGQFY